MLAIISVVFFQLAEAQSADSITVARGFLGYTYIYQDQRLNFNQLPSVMQKNTEARILIAEARKTNTISTILGGAGGFLVGWQLGSAVFSGEPNWMMVGLGGGLIAVSIPIFAKSNRTAVKAVDAYNAGLTVRRRTPTIRAALGNSGIGLALRF